MSNRWEKADAKHCEALRSAFLDFDVDDYEVFVARSVESTMDVAAALLQNRNAVKHLAAFELGEPLRAAIFAIKQTAGRGREGRAWVAVKGEGLYASYVFWPDTKPKEISGLSLVAGLAIVKALRGFGIEALLKWPNDVVVERDGALLKLAGLLVDLSSSGSAGVSGLVVGIGINIDESPVPEGIGMRGITTSPVRYSSVAASVTKELGSIVEEFFANGLSPFKTEWESSSAILGRPVTIVEGKVEHRGIPRGIDAQGGLIVETKKGERIFYSGTLKVN